MKNIFQKTWQKIGNFVSRYKKPIALTTLASIPASADARNILKMYLNTDGTMTTVTPSHLPDSTEGLDGKDTDFMELPGGEYEFYSNNPLAANGSGPKKAIDARPMGSYSTWTNYIDGYNLPAEGVNANLVFRNTLVGTTYDDNYEGNNVIVDVFENNALEGSDPNYVHIGKLDAVQATKVYPEAVFNLTIKPGYHKHAITVKHFKPSDVNFSGDVNLEDFAGVSRNLGTYVGQRNAYSPMNDPNTYTDIDQNGYVGLEDVAIVADEWLFQKPAYDIDQYDPVNPPANDSPPVSKVYKTNVDMFLKYKYLDGYLAEARQEFFLI